MRPFIEILFVIVLGLGLGGFLAHYSIKKNHGFGAIQIDGWTAWPSAGSKEADPYTEAKVAAQGEVPLGAAEGVAFHAPADDEGKELQRNCRYLISGQTPPARLWTISAHNPKGQPLFNSLERPSSTTSRQLLRNTDGNFIIHAGPTLAAGNWLEVQGTGPYQLIIRLYDTPITSANKIVDPEMPSIKRLSCI